MVSEDRDYVERILSGEPEVFDLLVRKYNRMAGAIAYGVLGDFHEAEDVVQEAFLKAFRALHALRDPGKFRAWFCGLVRTKSIDAIRQRPDRRSVDLSTVVSGRSGLGESVGDSPGYRVSSSLLSSSVEEDQIREESRQKVLDAIQELGPEDRMVVALKHMEGLSYKEIAEITGTSVSAVESRLFRARQLLRKKLAPSKT